MRQALELAREFVDNLHNPDWGNKERQKVLTAIKEALAQPERDYERGFIDGMQKQMQSSVDKAVNRMAQPEQEPVTWGVDWGKAGDIPCVSIIKRLPNGGIEVVAVEYAPYSYTVLPKRTWVGLTDIEWSDLYEAHHDKYNLPKQGSPDGMDYERAIEAKLKEKNNG